MKYGEMTAPKLREVDRDNTVVVIPIAAVEQHGPHLPTATDTIICTALVEALEQQTQDSTLLLPTLWPGASAHHLRFGATLDLQLGHHIAALRDIAQSVLNDGFRRVLYINGHGGNVDPLKVAMRELQEEYPDALLVGGSYWSTSGDLLADTLEGDHKFVGHACEFETSMIMHLRPELVNEAELRDAGQLIDNEINGLFVSRDMYQRTREGCTGRPDLATAAKGKELFAGIVGRLQATVERLLKEPLASSYDEFA